MSKPPKDYNPAFMLELLLFETSNWEEIRKVALSYLSDKSIISLTAVTNLLDVRFGVRTVATNWHTYVYWRELVFKKVRNERDA